MSYSNARCCRRKIQRQRTGIYLRAIVVGILAAGTGRVGTRLGGSDFPQMAPGSRFTDSFDYRGRYIVFFPPITKSLARITAI